MSSTLVSFVFLSLLCSVASINSNLDATRLDSLITRFPMVFVEFTNHGGYTQIMLEVQRDSSFSGVALGHVDANTNVDLAQRYKIAGTPVYKLFKGNKVYHCAGDIEDIKKFLHSFMQESPKQVASQSELDQYATGHDVVIVGFVKGAEKSFFERMADEHRVEFTFAIANFDSSTHPAPKIVVLHSSAGSVVGTEVYPGEFSEGPLHKWLQQHAIPYFTSVTSTKDFINYAMLEDPVAFLITNANSDNHQEYIEKFRSLAPSVRASSYLVHVDSSKLSKEVGGMLRNVASSLQPADKVNPHGLLVVKKGFNNHVLHRVDTHISHETLRAKIGDAQAASK